MRRNLGTLLLDWISGAVIVVLVIVIALWKILASAFRRQV
jgi:uncharacterized membrane protein YqiK